MDVTIITSFPQKFDIFNYGIMSRAIKNKLLTLRYINIHDILKKNNIYSADDRPYGGGHGMILSPKIFDYIDQEISIKNFDICIYMSPRGKKLTQKYVQNLSQRLSGTKHLKKLCILCGLYEGVDQRIIDYYNFIEVSIGDYILFGGEIPAMVLIESLTRLISGVIKKDSILFESFENNYLEHDLYTRPASWRNLRVPHVLLSGHHKKIKIWKEQDSLKNTRLKRPDLYKKVISENRALTLFQILADEAYNSI